MSACLVALTAFASAGCDSGQFYCRKESPSYTPLKECFPSQEKCRTPSGTGEPVECFTRATAFCAEAQQGGPGGEKYNICVASLPECEEFCRINAEEGGMSQCTSMPTCREFKPQEF
jgi:hypothetical protein